MKKKIFLILFFIIYYQLIFAQDSIILQKKQILDTAIVKICGTTAKFMIANNNVNPDFVKTSGSLEDLKLSIKDYPSALKLVETCYNQCNISGQFFSDDSISINEIIKKINTDLIKIPKYAENLDSLNNELIIILNNYLLKAYKNKISLNNVKNDSISDDTNNVQATNKKNTNFTKKEQDNFILKDFFIFVLLLLIILLIIFNIKIPKKADMLNKKNTDKKQDEKINKNIYSENELLSSIFNTKTITDRENNQDACIHFNNQVANFNAIILADGLGFYKYAGEGSKFVVNEIKKELLQLKTINELNIENLLIKTRDNLINYVKNNNGDITKTDYCTTVICAIETSSKIILFYLGNGSIWHIRSNFKSIKRTIPWNALNYMNPHSIEEGGKEVLERFISTNKNNSLIQPTIIEIKKDIEKGDILILTTDGIFSQDHIKIGTGKGDKVYSLIPKTLLKLFDYLYKLGQDIVIDNNKDLEKFVSEYLKELKYEKLIDDDTTIGVLITTDALNYLKKGK